MTTPAALTALAARILDSDLDGSTITAEEAAIGGDLGMHAAAAVQLQTLFGHLAVGDGLAGWKVGMTSGSNRDKMGRGVRPFGFIRRSRTFASGSVVGLRGVGEPGIEAEIGVLIRHPVAGVDLDRETLLAAVDGFVPCFELGHRRLDPAVSDAVRVAADLSQWGLVVGEPRAWAGSIADVAVTMTRDGTTVAVAGPGYGIDDPIDSLRELCAGLAPFGLGLLPGQYVITGAFSKARVAGPGRWRADFTGFGAVEVEYSD